MSWPDSFKPQGRLVDGALIVLLGATWGCYWPAMKFVLRDVDVWLFRSVCGLCGGTAFLFLLGLRGQSLAVPRAEWPALLLSTALNMVLFPLFSLLALRVYAAGSSVIIAYTMPVWVAAFSAAIGYERLTSRRIIALVFGAFGLIALLSNDIATTGGLPKGAVLVLLGAAVWAMGVLVQKHTLWKSAASVLTGWHLVLGTLPFVPLCFVLSDFSVVDRIDGKTAIAWIYSALAGFVFGYYLFYRLVARLAATRAATISLIVPFAGVLAGAALLGERIGLAQIVGLTSIATAVGLVLFEPTAVAKA